MSGAPEPLRPEALRDVIARHGLSASKALGQNFILDRNLLARIAAIPGKLEGETVYEVGPGPGGLTRALLDAGAKVVAVERDRRCIAALAELEVSFGARLTVVEADALRVDERTLAGEGAHVVANLPYNIGTALLLKWLGGDWPPWWRSLTLMFQKEVAERIVASPGSGAYGRLSVAAQWRSTPRIAMNVNRSAFVPPPKVTSAVVHIVPRQAPYRSRCGGNGAAYAGRLRSAPQDAALEPQAGCGRTTGARDARDRSPAARRDAYRRRIRPASASAQLDLGLGGAFTAATLGPRLIADDSWVSCGQPLAQMVCSFCRLA